MAANCTMSYVKAANAVSHGSSTINKGREDSQLGQGGHGNKHAKEHNVEPNFTDNFRAVDSAAV